MKKSLSMIMTTVMVISTVMLSFAVSFAGERNSSDLEKAITAVKQAVSIPESLDVFEYYYEESEDGHYDVILQWRDDENESYASAMVSDSGLVTSYSFYSTDFEGNGPSKVTRGAAEKIANKYVKTFIPNGKGDFRLQKSEGSYGDEYQFYYKMYVNDVPCDFVNINIGINKNTGLLSGYNCNASLEDIKDGTYPAKDGAISKDAAKKAYIDKLGPQLKYLSYYDYDKSALKVFAAYKNRMLNKAIDAKSAEVITLLDNYALYGGGARSAEADEKTMNAGSSISFSEAELAEIQKTKQLLNREQADKAAKNLTPGISAEKLVSGSLMTDKGPNQNYVWNLRYENCYVKLDAKSGTLISFSNYKARETKKAGIGSEKAQTAAESYISKVSGISADELALVENNNRVDYKDGDAGYDYTFTYERKVNGINFESNQISATVDSTSGNIISYYKDWYQTATFPDIKSVISKDAAFDKMADLADFGQVYKKSTDGVITLVYDFIDGQQYLLDAAKGIRIDNRGNAYTGMSEYTDIDGNWAEQTIRELQSNGYYLAGNKFEPKKATTQLEFFKYLYSPQQSYYTNDQFYDMLVRNKIIKKEEISMNSLLSRQDAAKFAARYLGVDRLAKEASIFKNVYSDTVRAEYVGYAAAAYAMGVMKSDSKGRFNGTATMNHGETACLINNILNVK